MNKGVGYILIPVAASVVVVQSIEDGDAQDAAHLTEIARRPHLLRSLTI